MGSPNFYTNTKNLNLGIDLGSIAKNIGIDEYCLSEFDMDEVNQVIRTTKDAIDDFINGLDTLYFYKIHAEYGYHNGVQIYIDEVWFNYEAFVSETVKDWERYSSITDTNGYEKTLDDISFNPIFRSNIKNLTRTNVERAIKNEYKTIHNALIELAKENGLTEIVGSGYTQNLSPKLFTRKI